MRDSQAINNLSYNSWLLVTIFYLYQYTIRIMPIAMRELWQLDFNMTATQFGIVAAVFSYSFALFQVPIGYLIDKFGVWGVTLASVIICTVGVSLNAVADNIQLVILSRFIIGIGSASPYICAMKVIFDQFPKSKQNTYTGLTLAIAMLGMIIFSKLLEILITLYDWRTATYLLIFLGLLLTATLLKFKPSKKFSKSHNANYSYSKIIDLIKTKEIWLYTFISICIYIPLPIFADIWAGEILSRKYDFTNVMTCQISMISYLGCMIGSLTLSTLSNERMVLLCSLIGSLLLMLLIMYFKTYPIILYLMFFGIGFCAGSIVISFRSIAKYVNIKSFALALGILSAFFNFGLGIINYCIGVLTDYLWDGTTGKLNECIYSLADYQRAITVVILPIMLIAITLLLPKFNLANIFPLLKLYIKRRQKVKI